MKRVFAVLVCVLGLAVAAAPAEPVTDSRVRLAIAQMQAHLWRSQDADGGWSNRQHERTGLSGLIVLSLLCSGESSQTPGMVKALDFLRREQDLGTYSASVRAQVWSYLPDAYLPDLRRDMQWLVNAADPQGQWSYDEHRGGHLNHSTTHFAALGLWESSRRDVLPPAGVWLRTMQHFLRSQNPDGGWGYTPGGSSTGSMTAAGLSVLLGAQQVVRREMVRADPQLSIAIDRGIVWLNEQFTGAHNPPNGGWNYYYLFALERVALAGGVRYFKQRDWFLEGADHILQHLRDNGSVEDSLVETAFSLIFLSRGRVPVWVSKLRLIDTPTHRRPNDIYYLNQYLGRLREGDMNWQLIGPDDPLEGWLSAPVLYLSGEAALQLGEQQKATLQNYLLRGGVLVANPDDGSERFSKSVRELAAQLFPQWPLTQLAPQHPLFHALHQIDGEHAPPVFSVHNGVRDLVILLDRDLGYVWQADLEPGNTMSWKVGANLWALLTDRGNLPGRLAQQPLLRRPDAAVYRTLSAARVWYDGNWNPEPAATLALSDLLANQHQMELQVQDVDVRAMTQRPALLLLSGVEAANIDQEILARLVVYVQQGGTLLVENVGGSGGFARDIEQRLGKLLNTAAIELPAHHPIINGSGLAGAHDCTRVSYRRYAVTKLSLRHWPRLAAIFIDNRPAVIIATEDLSLGLLDVPRFGVIGYSSDSARKLMANLMLWVHRQQAGAAEQEPKPPLPRVPYQPLDAERRTR